jgi:uncharacterized membrane protein YeaQ/YmgE (transglycosylase-associated protein family)
MFFVVLLSWFAVGLLVGFIASRVVSLRGDDPRLGIAAAAVGAVVAGIVYGVVSGVGVTVWTVWGNVFAAFGATLVVVVWHLIRSRTITHERFTARRSY